MEKFNLRRLRVMFVAVLTVLSAANVNAAVKDEKIIVVGAGVAGLETAKALRDAGYDVTVLEARDRLGGRTYTSKKWADCPIDLGASWIHGPEGHPLTPIVITTSAKELCKLDEIVTLNASAPGSELTFYDWTVPENKPAQASDMEHDNHLHDIDDALGLGGLLGGGENRRHSPLKAQNHPLVNSPDHKRPCRSVP